MWSILRSWRRSGHQRPRLRKDGHRGRRGVDAAAASVAGTRCTPCSAALVLSGGCRRPCPSIVAITSFNPPTPFLVARQHVHAPALALGVPAIHPEQVAGKSAASSPPVPARISRTTFFSSFGSFGMSKDLDLAKQRLRPGLQSNQFRPAPAPASSASSPPPTPSAWVDLGHHGLVLAELPDDRLDLGERLRVRTVLGLVSLHGRVAEQREQFGRISIRRRGACLTSPVLVSK